MFWAAFGLGDSADDDDDDLGDVGNILDLGIKVLTYASNELCSLSLSYAKLRNLLS